MEKSNQSFFKMEINNDAERLLSLNTDEEKNELFRRQLRELNSKKDENGDEYAVPVPVPVAVPVADSAFAFAKKDSDKTASSECSPSK